PCLRIWANEVLVRFGADTAGLNAGVAAAASQLHGFGSIVGLVGATAVSAFVGIGIAATKMSADFQESVVKLYTTAGEAQKNLNMVGKGMLDMSADVGTGANELARAMYFVESSGFHGAAALDVLRVAAMGARTENSNLDD